VLGAPPNMCHLFFVSGWSYCGGPPASKINDLVVRSASEGAPGDTTKIMICSPPASLLAKACPRPAPHWLSSLRASPRWPLASDCLYQLPPANFPFGWCFRRTCLDYLHLHTRTMRPSTASPMYLCAFSQRVLGVVPCLAPRSRQGTATPTARERLKGSTKEVMQHKG
jgi:hypothetical protein